MYKKLACECGHEYDKHGHGVAPLCHECLTCFNYDPAGHNPELENVLCPRCRLARLERPSEKTYICPACQYVMLESQVKELVG